MLTANHRKAIQMIAAEKGCLAHFQDAGQRAVECWVLLNCGSHHEVQGVVIDGAGLVCADELPGFVEYARAK